MRLQQSIVFTLLLVTPSVCSLNYKYYYERQPIEVGDHYSDNGNRVLNDGYGTSDWISESNAVAFAKGTDDWKPHLVLSSPSIVREIEIHYIVKQAWSKFAPYKVTLKTAKLDNQWEQTHSFTLSDSPEVDGGHNIKLSLPSDSCSRYVLIDVIDPKFQQSVITEITLHGESCEIREPQRSLIPPPEIPNREAHRLRGAAVDLVMLRR